jgi:hypothetical protein
MVPLAITMGQPIATKGQGAIRWKRGRISPKDRQAFFPLETALGSRIVQGQCDRIDGNVTKHGVSLQAAEQFDWNTALVIEDDRFDYGERRFYGLRSFGDRIHTLVYADGSHDDAIRVISLRRSTRSEVKRYET